MEIKKYSSKSCVKCKSLDMILKRISLPCPVQVIEVEDVGQEEFDKLGISSMPTLIISEGDKSETIVGLTSPKAIEETIAKIQG